MHANTSYWVGYQIERKVSGVWQILTPWKSLQVTSVNWLYGPPSVPPLDVSNEGIRVASTDIVPPAPPVSWIVFVKNLDCGWF